MKEIYLRDKENKGFISIIFDLVDDIYHVKFEIRNMTFYIHTYLDFKKCDIDCLIEHISIFKDKKADFVEWKSKNDNCHISFVSNEYYGDFNLTVNVKDNHHNSKICFKLDYLQLIDLDIMEYDEDILDNQSQIDKEVSNIAVKIAKTESDSLDFNLFVKDGFLEINKSFWLYYFEYIPFCIQFEDFVINKKKFSMNIMDSFLQIDFIGADGRCYLSFDVNDFEDQQSSASFVIAVNREKLLKFYEDFTSKKKTFLPI